MQHVMCTQDWSEKQEVHIVAQDKLHTNPINARPVLPTVVVTKQDEV